ncbi:helix-turn-helix transcriptional regulator [Pseudoalteromonas sp. JBTF-M23]|uniref:Helix-turn-helix transcriptional regulator n=1 Tax=Pseudoalteromonas caenipelagi TaxID=2726988 RepID=A0A849VE68_9GAMM|nr:AraC family transcriptional regulator [Pseudoalteromonas caenipelagi]NOU51425.1 helix-turn-helix transcriptional regulator [Pseudoalteromonas caenipelagi]
MTFKEPHVLEILFSSLSIGVGSFAMHLILDKVRQQAFYLPLLLLMLGLTIISASGFVFFAFEQGVINYIAVLAPCFLLLAPSLWFYTNGLVAVEPWRFKNTDIKHYVPALLSLVLSFTLLVAPSSTLQQMFFADEVENTVLTITISISIMFVLAVWFIQTTYYLFKLMNLTKRYHQQLKDVFCDLTDKKYKWLIYITVAMLANWIWGIASITLDEQNIAIVEPLWGQALCLITIWGFGYYGLKQQPGFANTYQQTEKRITNTTKTTESAPYQRSALTQENAIKIAEKIHYALQHERIYLDANLNLFKLAKHLNEPSQYVSQTLSQVMQTSFFECINNARVEAAKAMLLAGQGNVLEIAMSVGFNARSSFYKAFKRATGHTPSQFQKAHHS